MEFQLFQIVLICLAAFALAALAAPMEELAETLSQEEQNHLEENVEEERHLDDEPADLDGTSDLVQKEN